MTAHQRTSPYCTKDKGVALEAGLTRPRLAEGPGLTPATTAATARAGRLELARLLDAIVSVLARLRLILQILALVIGSRPIGNTRA